MGRRNRAFAAKMELNKWQQTKNSGSYMSGTSRRFQSENQKLQTASKNSDIQLSESKNEKPTQTN